MLPPKLSGYDVGIAALLAGAVPMQPSIGRRGSSRRGPLYSLDSRVATPFCLSICHVNCFASRNASVRRKPGSTLYGARSDPRITRAAVRLEAQQMDDKRVAGLRTFDIKRSRLWIRIPSTLRTGCVPTSRINRVGIHLVPWFNP